jgi:hypothetical protein
VQSAAARYDVVKAGFFDDSIDKETRNIDAPSHMFLACRPGADCVLIFEFKRNYP